MFHNNWQTPLKESHQEIRRLVVKAGKRILEISKGELSLEKKADSSPLTRADLASQESILQDLAALPPFLARCPVLSEEKEIPPYEERLKWHTWWLIDPLDGTKEFIEGSDEFTVNIALISRRFPGAPGYPVAGWIYAPAWDRLYEGIQGIGVYRIEGYQNTASIVEKKLPLKGGETPAGALPTSSLRLLVSRRHRNSHTEKLIAAFRSRFDKLRLIPMGSSLKFCLIAEGNADIYPRPEPTSMEWDTAAADALCRTAGLSIFQIPLLGKTLEYGKENLLNPGFVVAKNAKILEIVASAFSS